MSPYLLDVNVLIALAWPSHVHHRQAVEWFGRRQRRQFRTCPITQTAFVRISSNPSFTPTAVSPDAAMSLLRKISRMGQHAFWPDDMDLLATTGVWKPLTGHRQVTDAYLLALAIKNDGILATLDRRCVAAAGPNASHVELLSPTAGN